LRPFSAREVKLGAIPPSAGCSIPYSPNGERDWQRNKRKNNKEFSQDIWCSKFTLQHKKATDKNPVAKSGFLFKAVFISVLLIKYFG
jgi:hypothetical protein